MKQFKKLWSEKKAPINTKHLSKNNAQSCHLQMRVFGVSGCFFFPLIRHTKINGKSKMYVSNVVLIFFFKLFLMFNPEKDYCAKKTPKQVVNKYDLLSFLKDTFLFLKFF